MYYIISIRCSKIPYDYIFFIIIRQKKKYAKILSISEQNTILDTIQCFFDLLFFLHKMTYKSANHTVYNENRLHHLWIVSFYQVEYFKYCVGTCDDTLK